MGILAMDVIYIRATAEPDKSAAKTTQLGDFFRAGRVRSHRTRTQPKSPKPTHGPRENLRCPCQTGKPARKEHDQYEVSNNVHTRIFRGIGVGTHRADLKSNRSLEQEPVNQICHYKGDEEAEVETQRVWEERGSSALTSTVGVIGRKRSSSSDRSATGKAWLNERQSSSS